MFPADFEYFTPTSVDEALSLLAEHGDDAKILAGGQSLIPLMKLRFAAPAYIIDINRIPALDILEEDDADGGFLRVGSLVRTADIERSDLIASRYLAMKAAAPLISDPLVRNRGTLVGSLCHADPQGDWASVMMAIDAELVVRNRGGERRIPVTELIDGPFTTTMRADELATEVRVPASRSDSFGTYLKLERKIGDFASVGVAVHLDFDGGRVKRAGIALTAVGPANIKATAAEQALVGRSLDDASVDEAARLAAEASDPKTDLRGSADYKREMVRVYVRRGLSAAMKQRAA
jgi:aerobic carbon-monoxide dehydrogenase medium subunit